MPTLARQLPGEVNYRALLELVRSVSSEHLRPLVIMVRSTIDLDGPSPQGSILTVGWSRATNGPSLE